jgi:Restriction endonuclease
VGRLRLIVTFFGMLFFGGVLGGAAGVAVAGLIVRPLYVCAATALVPGLDAHRRFKDAEVTYQEALTKFNLWRARTLTEFWCSLDGVVFEREVARLYEGLGYTVRLTPQSSDGGVDVVLERAGSVTAVQCKAHRKKIGIAVGRELVTSAKDLGADRMMIACTYGVSAPLHAYAREKGIQIVTAGDLVYMQMGLKEMSAAKLLVERPTSIAKRLKDRIAASPGAGGSSRG